jgi:hypothetical protein
LTQQGGVAWVKELPLLNDTVIAYNDEFQRSRLRALQSVDEMVEKLVKMLEAKGLLDDTYIFYTTDNGYHLSQHRMHPGKECGYDTDIRVPLIVRGPGIARGRATQAVTSHTDLSPTIMKLAGQNRDDFDGVPIPLEEKETEPGTLSQRSRQEHINIEYWGMAIPEGQYGHYEGGGKGSDWKGYIHAARNNTYKGLRIIAEDYSLYYSVWCTGDREYYDVKNDPGQLDNLFEADATATRSSHFLAGRSFSHVIDRLDALMMVLKSCKGDACVNPWNVLHPGGNIENLKDALAHQFDAFYDDQPKVSFDSCELGYIREVEGPQNPNIYEEDYALSESRRQPASFKYQGHWSQWT